MPAAVLLLLTGLLAAAPAENGAAGADARQVRATLDEILAQPEYHRLRRPTAEPSPERAATPEPAAPRTPARALEPNASDPALSLAPVVSTLQIVVYGVLAVAVVFVLVLVIRATAGRSRSLPPGDASPAATITDTPLADPAETPPDEHLRRAMAQAKAGRHGEAIRLLLMGALSFIENAGLIRHRSGLTNGDYLRAVSRQPRLLDGLEPIVLAFDEVHFGRRGATAQRFDDCLRCYRAAFGR
jgi:hypothetical protein